MGVSTTHRINLSMWILIYSFSDTYYVWAACVSSGYCFHKNIQLKHFKALPSAPHFFGS